MGDTPLGKLIVELGIKDTQFSKGVKGAEAELKALRSDLKTSQVAFKSFGGEMDGLGSPMTKLNTLISKQKAYIGELAQQYKGSLNKQTGEATRATDKYARNLSLAKSQLAGYYAEQKNLADQVRITAQEQYKQNALMPKIASGFDTTSKKLNSFGDAMLPASVALTGVFYKGIQSATEFDGKMTEIQSLLADGTPSQELGKNMDVLSEKSKEWARQYGISTTSINEGMEEMIKKGYNFNQTLGAMPAVLDASKASGEDFDTVMTASTSTLEQFGLTSKNTAEMTKNTQMVTDSLSFVANKTAAGFSDMGNAMEYVGPVAHSVGMSVQETSAAIGLLSNNGIEGEKAGTALRGALSRLLKPSKQAAGAMQELGINLDAFKKGQIGLPDILDEIKASTEGMTDAQKSSLIATAFGTEAQTGMNILVSQGGDALRNLTKETQNATGYTKELADQMNNSDKNAFARAKATLETLSIDLGEKLLPALVPVVEEVDDLAGRFSDLDPKTQRMIVNMGLLVAASYPASKALGGLTSIVGFLPKQMAKWGALGAGKVALKGIETEAIGATAAIGGSGGLTSGFSALTPVIAGIGPVGWTALGTAGLAGTILTLSKVTEKARGELQQTSDWGTVVGKESNQQLKTFQDKLESFNSAFVTFEGSGTKSAENVTKAFKDLTNTVSSDIDKAKNSLGDKAEALGISKSEVDAWKKNMDQQKNNVQSMSDQVIDIYKNSAEQKRNLTAEEMNIVKNNEAEIMKSEINSLQISGDKKAAVQAAIYGKINATSEKQLKDYQSAIEQAVKAENSGYKKNMDTLKQSLEQGIISQQEYEARSKALTSQHNSIMDTYGKNLAKVMQQSMKYYQTDGDAAAAWKEKTSQKFKALGLDYDQISQKMQKQAETSKNSSGLVAQYTSTMTEEGKKASDAWNAMVYDEKTGKVSTNATQKVAEAMKAAGGWQNIQWIEKNAKLDTNALITVAQAAQANGMWNSLTPEQKNLTVNNKQGLEAIVNSKENLKIWNSMPANVKRLLGENKDFVNKSSAAKSILSTWNGLTPKEKELKAKNLTVQPTEEAQKVINSLKDRRVTLGATNGTIVPAFEAQKTINNVKGKNVNLTATNKAQPGKNSAQATINSLKGTSRDLFANNRTQPGKNSAQNTMDSLQNVTRNLQASNLTGPGVASANSSIQSGFRGKTVNLNANDAPAQSVLSGLLNSIPASRTIDILMKQTKLAQGTPYHKGGLAVVNDQKGSTYKEMITLPTGQSFIPEGRDVTLPLPKGSRVLKARETAKIIPKYANGVGGVPRNAKIFQKMDEVQQQLVINAPNLNDNSQVVLLKGILQALLQNGTNNDVIQTLQEVSSRPIVGVFDIQDTTKKLAPLLTKEQARNTLINKLIEGKNP